MESQAKTKPNSEQQQKIYRKKEELIYSNN